MGKPVAFAGQRGAARHARIHLNHGHLAVFGIHRELHVGPAGFHAHFAYDRRRRIAHALKFLVRQRLRRRHGNGIAGVHAHGVKIFDGADDHEIVAVIAHHFEFVFFPAEHRFFHQRFVHRTHVQRVRNRFAKLLAVVRDGAAGAAQRKRRPNHQRESQLIAKPQRVLRIIHERGGGNFQANFAASILEPQPVLGHLYCAQRSPNHFHAMLFEDAALSQLHRKV